MKKLILLASLLISNLTHAGWVDSDWTEPVTGCVGAGIVGYAMAAKGTEAQNAALFCAVGAAAGVMLNNYYDNKVGKQYTNDMTTLKKQLKAYQIRQATDAALGIDSNLSIKREVIPGTKRADGTVTAPTIQYELDQAGTGAILGD